MNSSFVYHVPTKIYFGENQLANLASELKVYGTRVLITYGGGSIKKIGLYDKVMAALKDQGLTVFEFSGIEPNPRHSTINKAIALCKQESIDVLLAIGGGSTIDATKFIGAGVFHDGDVWDFFIGKAKITKSLPILTILTLAAAGSEMDAGGVVTNLDSDDKLATGHPSLLPKVSFLDPTNTYSVSPYQTACGCADILSHIFEVYFNLEPDLFMLDTVMEGLMRTIIKYGPIAIKDPNNYEARANIMWASSWAINGFIEGGKDQAWSCHPMEHSLSAYYDITHGLGLAILTPRWLQHVLNEKTAPRIKQFGVQVFGLDSTLPSMIASKMAIERLSDFLFEEMKLQSHLEDVGIDETHFDIMAQKACRGRTIHGFQPLKKEDIISIYRRCL